MGAHNSILSGRPGDRCRIRESWHVCFWVITIVVLINQSIISTIKIFILNHQSKKLNHSDRDIDHDHQSSTRTTFDTPPPPQYRCDTLDLLEPVQLGGMYSLAAKSSNNKLSFFFMVNCSQQRDLESRQALNANLHYTTKLFLYLLFTIYYMYTIRSIYVRFVHKKILKSSVIRKLATLNLTFGVARNVILALCFEQINWYTPHSPHHPQQLGSTP